MEVRNRFKGLDLIDRVPDELWNEVHDIVQETGIKTIPMEKKHKKAKWLSAEALQIAVKRREASTPHFSSELHILRGQRKKTHVDSGKILNIQRICAFVGEYILSTRVSFE